MAKGVDARTGERLEQQIAELAAERDRLASGAEIAPVSADRVIDLGVAIWLGVLTAASDRVDDGLLLLGGGAVVLFYG